MSKGWYVTAQDIKQWTDTNRRQVQDTLPLLVRKLIFASVNPSLLSFPAGDSVLLSGWDGVLNAAQGNAFVPKGDSVWEFSTNQRVNDKADSDYQKRSNDPQGVDQKNTSFVFVTSRTWANRDDWVKRKNGEGQWAQVKGLNADDLEAWLEQCPAVHRWFARLIGMRPEGAWDIEQAWDSWSCATKPASIADLLLASRQDQANELVNHLKAEPSVIRVWGESEEEAYAFTLAVVNQHVELSVRLLVVKSPNDWDILLDSRHSLILIPQFDKHRNLGLAIQRGHWVILLESSQQYSGQKEGIKLGKANRDQQISALVAMGLDEDTATDVVKSCRGYLQPIRRHYKLAPFDYQRPAWATAEPANLLLVALLAGTWNATNSNDCEKLAELAGIPSYAELEQQLNRWALSDDPPVRRMGNTWQIVSRQDAWALLSSFINESILERFGQVAKEVLHELDPRFELPPEERWMATVHGKVTRHSGLLRQGLAEMLAMLASYGNSDCRNVGSNSVQDQVSLWVRALLMEDLSGLRWGSLGRALPLLAEAAPDIFLEAVETGLQGETPPLMELFIEEGDMGGCPHADLLRALESVSWNLNYLAHVVRILAKLSRLDPGGCYSNRPSNCLREIFQGWLPQTKASLDQRLNIIDTVIRFEPDSGWQLLMDLLPERGGGFSTPIHQPEFRDWAEGWKKGVTCREYHQHIVAIGERVLKHVDEVPNTRWPEVIKELPQLPKESFDVAVTPLRGKDLGEFNDTAVNKIRNELREIICHHREFSDARWALPKEAIDQLDEIYLRFIPDDLVESHRFLFDKHFPNLADLAPRKDYEERQKLIEQARSDALEKIWDVEQTSGIERLAASAKFAWSLGTSLGTSSFKNEIEEFVLSWLGDENQSLDQTAKAYANARYNQVPDWLDSIREKYYGYWNDETWAAFCLGLPFNRAMFNFLETLPESVVKRYWREVKEYYLQKEDNEYSNWVIEQLLAHNRPLAAINAAAQYLQTIARKTGLNGDILAKTLELAAINPDDYETTPVSSIRYYDIVEVIKSLQSSADINDERLAHIEWMYVRIFHSNDIKPVALLKEATKNPSFFVQLICLAFKADPPIEEEFSDISPKVIKQQAENAWYLLKLIDQLPGQNNAGQIDTAQLQEWVKRVREESTHRNRSCIGDVYIGELLSHSPAGSDGVWPHEAVRVVLERDENRDIEEGIEVGLYNQRGATMRYIEEGGQQERELAEKYQQQADKIKYTWPRTSTMLGRIAEIYRGDAARRDLEVELH